VLKDGTDVVTNPFSPNAINFADDVYFADGAMSNPIKISESWLYSYNSSTPDSNSNWDNYYQWNAIGSTGLLKVGEGYTMKGTGGTAAISAQQNYVFIGKPNSGDITLNIASNDTYLIGNPYPSALDADEFIKDNLKDCTGCRASANVFNGALYFWDHFGLSNNHFLAEYEGGYATYTLMGGVAGVADDPLNVNNGLTGSKIPKRYIPVAQGFFIDAYTDPELSGAEIPTTVSGGSIVFKNSQRAFVRESSGNAVFMKINPNSKPKITEENTDTRSKIRLGFVAATGAHRQLLIGTDINATTRFDIGYDAQLFDLQKNDMFWKINNTPFVIQAVPNFNSDQIIPIGLAIENDGPVTLKIDTLENISSNTAIYLYDNTTDEYHNLRDNSFTISLLSGEYNDRFSLRFSGKTLSTDEMSSDTEIKIFYANNYKILIIQNKLTDTSVEKVMLFDLLGQMLTSWDTSTENQTKIQLPIKNTATGIYIVKLKTSNGDFSKKIVVR
jgi:large repetitive protein